MITLTDEQGIALVREVVAERGDHFVYHGVENEDGPSCLYLTYAPDGEVPKAEGCLVGSVLLRAGVPMSSLQRAEGSSAVVLLNHPPCSPIVECSPLLAAALLEAQRRQDRKMPYGMVLAAFERDMGAPVTEPVPVSVLV